MLRIVYLGVIIYLLYRLIKGFFSQGRKYKKNVEDDVLDQMVQDPVCKVYIPRREAYRRSFGGKDILFCSKDCARKFEFDNSNS
jgi:YHS domain-containing protein